MPRRAKRICSAVNCSTLVDKPGPCASCRSQRASAHDRVRGSAASRGYGKEWRRLRAYVLQRDPLCVDCKATGRMEPATDVDHILPRAQGGTDALENLAPRCHACHSRKTAREDGGFGNQPRPTA